MTDPDLRVAPTVAGTTSAPMARAATVDVFQAARSAWLCGASGSVPAAAGSVGPSGRAWAMIGSLVTRPRNASPAVVPVGALGWWVGGLTEVVVGSGERRED